MLFAKAVVFVLETFLGLFSLALLLRFLLQLVRAPARNQLSHFVVALTDFVVRPARRVIPGLLGLDLSSLVLAWLVEFVLLLAVLMVRGADLHGDLPVLRLALLAGLNLVRLGIYIIIGATVVQALLSWVSPGGSPLAPVLSALTRPLLSPLRRWIPPLGNVDLSPLFLLVACQLVIMVPLAWLESLLRLF
ncbi:MAG: YggT family protein [Betaproteobacteria bacterium]|jgi:YggT family protein